MQLTDLLYFENDEVIHIEFASQILTL